MLNAADIVNAIKLHPKHWWSIAVVSALFLFLPKIILNHLGIFDLVERFRQWIAIAFLISTGLLIAHGLVKVFKLLIYLFNLAKLKIKIYRKLNTYRRGKTNSSLLHLRANKNKHAPHYRWGG